MSLIDDLRDADMIAILERRGYVVRHQGEALRTLSWNRTEPIPSGVDFAAEALEKLRDQITPEMIRFETRQSASIDPTLSPTIRSAFLRIL